MKRQRASVIDGGDRYMLGVYFADIDAIGSELAAFIGREAL